MKKNTLTGMIWGVTILFMTTATACAASVKIGIIDTQKIMRDSRAAKDARGIFLMDLEKKRAELRENQIEIQQKEKALREKQKEMPAETFRAERDKLARDVKELRRLKNDMEEELKKKDASLTREILQEVVEIVRRYTTQKKYTVVLEKKAVVAFDDAADITDDIIKMYDAEKKN